MNGATVVHSVLGLAAALLIGPIILFCLYPQSVRVWFEAGPEGIGARASQGARDVIAVLAGMGFRPIGVKVEKPVLRAALRDLAFVAEDGRCYGSVAGRGGPARLYFYTPFPDGGLVLTSNGLFPKIRSTTVIQQSFRGCAPRELLDRHHEALASLGRNGEVGPTPEARVAATHAYYATPEVRRQLRRTAMVLLVWMAVLAWFWWR